MSSFTTLKGYPLQVYDQQYAMQQHHHNPYHQHMIPPAHQHMGPANGAYAHPYTSMYHPSYMSHHQSLHSNRHGVPSHQSYHPHPMMAPPQPPNSAAYATSIIPNPYIQTAHTQHAQQTPSGSYVIIQHHQHPYGHTQHHPTNLAGGYVHHQQHHSNLQHQQVGPA